MPGQHSRALRALIASFALQFLVAGAAAADTNAPGISPSTQFTPVVAQVLTVPQPVKASDGQYHIAYELVLTNAIIAPVTIKTMEVRDAGTGRVVLSLAGPALAAQLNPIGNATAHDDKVEIASSSTSILWLDVVFSSKETVSDKIDHRIVGEVVTPDGPRPFESVVETLAVDKADPIVLAQPVSDGIWLMSEGCCIDFTHHRHGLAPIDGNLYVPQRFAIDYYSLDDQNRTWIGDPHDVASYLSYGKPTLAAADGLVVVASDGRPDQKPPEPPPIPPIADTVGNHVIIEVKPGTYLLYAHMKPGSIVVKVGDHVNVGQQIGLIGTTGNSTTPHLHFQLLTKPTFFPSDSQPYVFEKFELIGHETERIWDDNLGLQPNGTIPVKPATNPGPRANVMPLDRDIVRFSGSGR
jgi:hypothetical protein